METFSIEFFSQIEILAETVATNQDLSRPIYICLHLVLDISKNLNTYQGFLESWSKSKLGKC